MGRRLLTSDWFRKGFGGAEQIGFGYPVLRGIVWPFNATRILLFRRSVYPGAVSNWRPAGIAQSSETTISNYGGLTHGATTGWEYAAAKCFANGFRSDLSEPVRVDFDGGGDIISPALPTWPRSVDVIPGAAGVYTVSWTYSPWGQGAGPTDFEIYEGGTVATIDYNTPLDTVAYDPSTLQFEFETGAYGDGTLHAFAVRARNSGGVEERNEFTTLAIPAEDGTPNAANISYGTIRPSGG